MFLYPSRQRRSIPIVVLGLFHTASLVAVVALEAPLIVFDSTYFPTDLAFSVLDGNLFFCGIPRLAAFSPDIVVIDLVCTDRLFFSLFGLVCKISLSLISSCDLLMVFSLLIFSQEPIVELQPRLGSCLKIFSVQDGVSTLSIAISVIAWHTKLKMSFLDKPSVKAPRVLYSSWLKKLIPSSFSSKAWLTTVLVVVGMVMIFSKIFVTAPGSVVALFVIANK